MSIALDLRSRILATLALGLLTAGLAAPVAAQEQPKTSTTTTTQRTTSTAPPTTVAPTTTSTTTTTTTSPPRSSTSTSSTTTTAPGSSSSSTSTTTTTIDPAVDTNGNGVLDPDERTEEHVDELLDAAPEDDPVAPVDAPPDEVALSDFEVPVVAGQRAAAVIRREITIARADAIASSESVAKAKSQVDFLNVELGGLQREIAKLDIAQQLTIERLAIAKEIFLERVAAAVVRGGASDLELFVQSDDAVDATTRRLYLSSISAADLVAVNEFVSARDRLDAGLVVAVDAVAEVRRRLRSANGDLASALADNAEKRFQLAVFAAGSEIVIEGFVFPVGAGHSFIDSWGYPRMTGSEYEHTHKGTDIMAPFGTPLYATERGVISKIGTDVLGGQKLWLKGQSGTYYYYAHLQKFAEGLHEGMLVSAGDIVGTVGDSGNAKGGPPHLHFQVHPGGGDAVNPYALLKIIADLSER